MSKFQAAVERNLKLLETYVPIVDRVHGEHHPEFHEVRRVFEWLTTKLGAAGGEGPELAEEFSELRAITNNYTVPGDVCETYEAVYKMLAELDQAYHN